MASQLTRQFYHRDTIAVAHDLLGKHLVHVVAGRERIGRIVEVEAYLGPHDRASHSARGLTPRTQVMFGPPGHAYVYLIYGRYHCTNVVTEGAGRGAAVLLRALEPVANLTGRSNGPGLLSIAMSLDLRRNGADLTGGELFLRDPGEPAPRRIARRPRIGVDSAGPRWAGRLLRFYVKGSPFVSRR